MKELRLSDPRRERGGLAEGVDVPKRQACLGLGGQRLQDCLFFLASQQKVINIILSNGGELSMSHLLVVSGASAEAST